jgi:F420H(2)-dependent quinone reductase
MGPDQDRSGERGHARRPPGAVNSLVLVLLRSPLYRLLGSGMCELSYVGRRSGRRVSLPVLFAAGGRRVVVLVGDAPDKRWWRNFVTPGPIEVRQGRRSRAGTARIVPPDDPAYPAAWQLYATRHHIAKQPTDRLLLIEVT